MTDSQCQICIQFEAEDICILSEMLTQITNPIPDHKIPLSIFPHVFKNLKFRKCLAQIFDSKYLEICEKCAHNRLSQVFLPLFSNSNTDFNEQEITQQIEEGLDKLYESIQEKQTKLKQSKEQFDRLAQQLFNCEDDVNDSDSLGCESSSNEEISIKKSILEKNDDDDQQPIMQFNKNSNKNKFQKRSIDILKKWFLDHLDNPYPDNTEKQRLSKITGMHVRQIQNWFTNSRKRYLEPLKKKFEHGLVKDSESPEEESSKEQKKSRQQQQVQQPPPQKKVKMEDAPPPIKPEQTNVKQEQKQPIQQPIPQISDINLLQQQQFLQFQQMQQMAQLQQLQWMNPLNQLPFQLAPQFLSQFYNDPQKMSQMAGIPPLLQMPQLPMMSQMQPPGLQFLQANLGQAAAQQAPLPGLQLQIPNMQFLQGQLQQQGNQAMMYQLYQLPNDQKKQTQ